MDGETQTAESTPVETNIAQETPATNEAEQVNGANGEAKPAGFDKVEFTPEQQERVNRIYGNMKRYENDAKEMRRANEILMGQFEELQRGQREIVQHINKSDFSEAETSLRQKANEAFNSGNVSEFLDINRQITEITTKRLLAEGQKQQPKSQQQQQSQGRALSASEALEMSIQNGETSPEEGRVLRAYFSETDETGNLKRPWVNVGDVRNSQVSKIGEVVFDPNHPVFGNWTLKQKLEEVDRQMGVQKKVQGSNVLPGGNLTRQNRQPNVQLSDYEKQIALRMRLAGKDKGDEEQLEAWKKAKAKHSTRSR